VRRFLFDGTVLSMADVTQVIDDSAASFAAADYGLWLIREAGGRDLVGTCGLRPLHDLGLEVIYSLSPGAQGNGYATEAASAMVQYALGPLGLPAVLAEIDQDNAASAAVAQRLGMTVFEVVPGVLGPTTRYRKTRRTGAWPGMWVALPSVRVLKLAALTTLGSQTGSQHRQASGHIRRQPAMVSAARSPIRPHSATCSDGAYAPEKRKVGGSTPPLTTTLTCADVHLVIVKVQLMTLVVSFLGHSPQADDLTSTHGRRSQSCLRQSAWD
jgi:[ribosomal protein S5]-alanine N-acetyltransferase